MHRLDVATAAVARAALLARRLQTELVSDEAVAKKDRSPVTIADFAVQAALALELARELPGDAILGEEDATYLRTSEAAELRRRVVAAVSTLHADATETAVLDALDRCHTQGVERFWTLDPIDGTKGFLRRGQYAVALALVEAGEVVLGVLGCPNLPTSGVEALGEGCLLWAERGAGAWQVALGGGPERQVRVSSETDPSRASFLESVEAEHSAHDQHAAIARDLGVAAPSVRIDSQCKYAALARGDGAIYLRLPRNADYQEKIWDHAAGALIVESAGGRVTDAHGRPLDFGAGPTLAKNTGIVASNGPFHERLIRSVLATL